MEEDPAAVAAALGRAALERVELRPRGAARAGARGRACRPWTTRSARRPIPDPFALLGECTLAPAVIAGLRRAQPDLALVWLDAPGDLNTPETTPSGFLGGMPLAILAWLVSRRPARRRRAGAGACRGPGRARRRPRPRPRRAKRRSSPSRLVVADDVAAALAGLPADAPLHLHLDGDVLDPLDAPGVDFPAPGGWRLSARVDEMAALAATGRVVGVSLCCGNPRRDPDGPRRPRPTPARSSRSSRPELSQVPTQTDGHQRRSASTRSR